MIDIVGDQAYYVGMNGIQYTIRSIPTKLDQALRHRSKATGKSLNDVVLAALEKGTGISANSTFNDLDWFIGGKSLSGSFGEDIQWLDSLPKDI